MDHCHRRLLSEGNRGPVCQLNPLLHEACCLPGPKVKDVMRKLPTLVWPLGKPTIINLYSREVARNCNKKPKGNQERCDWSLSLKALGWLVGGSGAQVVFSLCFLLQGLIREERGRATRSIPGSEPGVTERFLGFQIMGWCTWHWACWWQIRYTCLKAGKGSLHRNYQGSLKEL